MTMRLSDFQAAAGTAVLGSEVLQDIWVQP